jgi:hypothetical protein
VFAKIGKQKNAHQKNQFPVLDASDGTCQVLWVWEAGRLMPHLKLLLRKVNPLVPLEGSKLKTSR